MMLKSLSGNQKKEVVVDQKLLKRTKNDEIVYNKDSRRVMTFERIMAGEFDDIVLKCPVCEGYVFIREGHCMTCTNCGWSKCDV